jgi:hypothetical protein
MGRILVVVLLLLWLLGVLSSHTLGGFVHVLLVAALILLFTSFIQGRRTEV